MNRINNTIGLIIKSSNQILLAARQQKFYTTLQDFENLPNSAKKLRSTVLDESILLENEPMSCRVCLKSGSIPIFGSEDAEDVSEAFSMFGGVEIAENDNFPKNLCVNCYKLLQSAILFRTTVQETDKLLRQPKLEEFDTVEIDYSDSEQSERKSKKYHCNRCTLDFENWKSYSEHTKSDSHRNFKVECNICKGLYTTIYIKKHILRHKLDAEQAFVCDVCGKSFVVLGAFNRHKAIHGYDLPYECKFCPYKGRFSESLKMHMRTHTGEKPYSCPQCNAKFVNKSNLNRHLSTHKSVHDYKCDGCGRGYFRKRELELHIKVYHSGVKEHVCNICGKAFGYRKQMMKHQLKVHKRAKLKSGRVPLYIQAEQRKSILAQHFDVV